MEPIKRDDRFKRPVKWLLGRKLLLELFGMLIYAIIKRRPNVDWMTGEVTPIHPKNPGELWFDFIADTGDGQFATYRVATLCFSDLWLTGKDVTFTKENDESIALPKGEFLVIGGDLAYPTATRRALLDRVVVPFRWARRKLDAGERKTRRPFFAIPGNHDYYDALSGFSWLARANANARPNRRLPGFVTDQSASYFALQLPFDWWFFGLDTQGGHIDERQAAFFANIVRDRKSPPRKVILATPEPTTVFGRSCGAGDPISKSLGSIGLEHPFIQNGELENEVCRLDLSGDVHHYARYWGPRPEKTSASYASVQSGLGGAFLHPSHTKLGDIPAQALYPSPDESRATVNGRLFNPVVMLTSGNVGAVGALVAALVCAVMRTKGALPPSFGSILIWQSLTALALTVAGAALLALSAGSLKTKRPRMAGMFVLALVPLMGLCPDQPTLLGSVFVLVTVVLANVAAVVLVLVHGQRITDVTLGLCKLRVVTAFGLAVFTCAVVAIVCTVQRFCNMPARLFTIDACLLLLVALGVGLVVLAPLVGAKDQSLRAKSGFTILGFVHAGMQLATPYLWSSVSGWGWAILVIGLFGAHVAAYFAARKGTRGLLLLLALGVAAGAILLPRIAPSERVSLLERVVGGLDWNLPVPVPQFWLLVTTALIGAVFSTIWFGWYLAVAVAFDGHNNEAGGAARIENFVELVRVRVTENALEVFVIAATEETLVEGKRETGVRQLTLIDQFELTCERSAD